MCVRAMGTEMTLIASQEPSRTTTSIRATTPVRRSPIASGASTPISIRRPQTDHPPATVVIHNADAGDVGNGIGAVGENDNVEPARKTNPLETRAMTWDEAERAKYMARFKCEEVKIQAWENHEKRNAEMEM